MKQCNAALHSVSKISSPRSYSCFQGYRRYYVTGILYSKSDYAL